MHTDFETTLYRLAKSMQSLGFAAFEDSSQRSLQGELFVFSYPATPGQTNFLEALAYGYTTVDSRAVFLPAFVDPNLEDGFSKYVGNIVTDTDAALNRLIEFGIKPIKVVTLSPPESNKDYKKELKIARIVRGIGMGQPEDMGRFTIKDSGYQLSGLDMRFYQPITANEPIEVQAFLNDYHVIVAGYVTRFSTETEQGTKLSICSHNPVIGYQYRDRFTKFEKVFCYSPEVKRHSSFQTVTPLTRAR
jgi:hypothetical protein